MIPFHVFNGPRQPSNQGVGGFKHILKEECARRGSQGIQCQLNGLFIFNETAGTALPELDLFDT